MILPTILTKYRDLKGMSNHSVLILGFANVCSRQSRCSRVNEHCPTRLNYLCERECRHSEPDNEITDAAPKQNDRNILRLTSRLRPCDVGLGEARSLAFKFRAL